MYFVTLGHFFASSCASADVTRRQLLAPKPSASASVIFLLPHHDGAPASGLPVLALPPPPLLLPPLSPPHAATRAPAATSAASFAPCRTAVRIFTLLLGLSFTAPRIMATPPRPP